MPTRPTPKRLAELVKKPVAGAVVASGRNPSAAKTKADTDTNTDLSAIPRKRLSRQERSPLAQIELLDAAAQVVGEYGYADASIVRITDKAGMAPGTFYLYFASRQVLFDQLLPKMGLEMLEFIGAEVHGAADVFEMEERGFRAFCEYQRRNPGFFRILSEAEVASPTAYRAHYDQVVARYRKALQRGALQGHLRHFSSQELEVVIYVLMAARPYLYQRFVQNEPRRKVPAEWVVQAYMKLLRNGLR